MGNLGNLHSTIITLNLCSNHSIVSTSNPLDIKHSPVCNNIHNKVSNNHTLEIKPYLCSNLGHFHQHSMGRLHTHIRGCHNRLHSMETTQVFNIPSSLNISTRTLVISTTSSCMVSHCLTSMLRTLKFSMDSTLHSQWLHQASSHRVRIPLMLASSSPCRPSSVSITSSSHKLHLLHLLKISHSTAMSG